jgi:hypothetical protein
LQNGARFEKLYFRRLQKSEDNMSQLSGNRISALYCQNQEHFNLKKNTFLVLFGWPIGVFSDIEAGIGKKQGFWISDPESVHTRDDN